MNKALMRNMLLVVRVASGIKLGLFASTPCVPLSRNIPRKRAFEMLVTGDFIDAKAALEFGLVNRVVPQNEVRGGRGKRRREREMGARLVLGG